MVDWRVNLLPPQNATYQPYQRFDYKTPGSWLSLTGITPNQAASQFDSIYNTNVGQNRADLRKYVISPLGGVKLANPGTGVSPSELQRIRSLPPDQFMSAYQSLMQPMTQEDVSDYKRLSNLAGQGTVRQQEWFRKNIPNITPQSSVAERAGALDAYHRYIQGLNQLPKRGLLSSLPFQLATIGLGAGFGAPGLIAKGFTAAGLGAIKPAYDLLSTISTVRGLANSRS